MCYRLEMNRLVPFFVLVLFLGSCSTQADFETDYKVYEVQGAVRQIVYKNAESNTNDIVVTYNKDGMLLSEKMRGRTIEYQYDGKYVQSLKMYSGDSLDLKRTYTYNNNLPVEIKEYDKNGTFRKRVIYEYDTDGNRVKGVILSPYKDTMFVWKYSFRGKDVQKEERINYQNGGDFTQHFDYEYDLDGNLSAIVEYDESILVTKTEYTNYHGIALQTKVLHYWDDVPTDSVMMTYGFDEKGNWIFKRTTTANRQDIRQERTILYYK